MSDPISTTQFWMTWSVQLLAAAATLSAVAVALFGQGFRAKFFPPKLSLRLESSEGEKTKIRLTWREDNVEKERSEDARYFHLRVSNERRWSTANQVQVVLLQVEEPGADGQYRVSWVGDVPLGWRHQAVFPTLRTIGPAAHVDLCSVVKDKWLQIHTLIAPYNLDVVRRGATRLALTVQARSDEADSAILRVEVSWDGKWHDGAQEMQRHLVLKTFHEALA